MPKDKTPKWYFDLIYIRGFFDKGTVGKEEWGAKPYFILRLLKGSVNSPDKISFTQSAINGYIIGNATDTLFQELKNADFSVSLLSDHIKGLYPTTHRNTKTYNDYFGEKNYQKALYDKVSKEINGITEENMADKLAETFNSFFTDTLDETTNDESIYSRYMLSELEKKLLVKLFELAKKALNNMEWKVNIIWKKQRELKRLTDSEKSRQWDLYLKAGMSSSVQLFDEAYLEFEKLCSNIKALLEPKKQLHSGIKDILSIINDISSTQYKLLSPDIYDYKAFYNMRYFFTRNIDKILKDLDKM